MAGIGRLFDVGMGIADTIRDNRAERRGTTRGRSRVGQRSRDVLMIEDDPRKRPRPNPPGDFADALDGVEMAVGPDRPIVDPITGTTTQGTQTHGCSCKYTCEEKCAYNEMMKEKCKGCSRYFARRRRYRRPRRRYYRRRVSRPRSTYRSVRRPISQRQMLALYRQQYSKPGEIFYKTNGRWNTPTGEYPYKRVY